jgi:hypothetical protein
MLCGRAPSQAEASKQEPLAGSPAWNIRHSANFWRTAAVLDSRVYLDSVEHQSKGKAISGEMAFPLCERTVVRLAHRSPAVRFAVHSPFQWAPPSRNPSSPPATIVLYRNEIPAGEAAVSLGTGLFSGAGVRHAAARTNRKKRGHMSSHNGDKARFHKLRKQKLRRRELMARLAAQPAAKTPPAQSTKE